MEHKQQVGALYQKADNALLGRMKNAAMHFANALRAIFAAQHLCANKFFCRDQISRHIETTQKGSLSNITHALSGKIPHDSPQSAS